MHYVKLKAALANPQMLAHPDFTKPFILRTVGVELIQEHVDGNIVSVSQSSISHAHCNLENRNGRL